jgi:hypothetical protein
MRAKFLLNYFLKGAECSPNCANRPHCLQPRRQGRRIVFSRQGRRSVRHLLRARPDLVAQEKEVKDSGTFVRGCVNTKNWPLFVQRLSPRGYGALSPRCH